MVSSADSNFVRAQRASIPVRARTREAADSYGPSPDMGCVFLAAAAVTAGTVLIPDWPTPTPAPAAAFLETVADMGAYVVHAPDGLCVTTRSTSGDLCGVVADVSQAADTVSLLLVLAALASSPSTFRGVHPRMDASAVPLLQTAGADIRVEGTTVTVSPRPLGGVRWTGGTVVSTFAGLVLGLVIDDVYVDVGHPTVLNAGLVSEWNRILHADEHLLPGSAALPHHYLVRPTADRDGVV